MYAANFRRWDFPQRWLPAFSSYATPSPARRLAETALGRLLGIVLPADCRLCQTPLHSSLSRIPVCQRCLAAAEPIQAEHFCAACRTAFLNPRPLDESGRCYLCRHQVNRFDAAYAFGSYDAELRELIRIFKYQRVETLARPLGRLLSRALPREEAFDAIVPVPLHWRRKWARGFDQAEALSRELSRHTGLPVIRGLRRSRATAAQSARSQSIRRKNVAGAFTARVSDLGGKKLLLIDDVFTTGATASACAAALKGAGARSITVLTVARADRRGWAAVTQKGVYG